jgi:hypothetical protein
LKKRDWNRIQAEGVNYLGTVKSCSKPDPLRNEAAGNELAIFLLQEETTKYREKWKIHLRTIEQCRIPSGRQDIGRPRRRYKENVKMLEAGTGDSRNPWNDDDVD